MHLEATILERSLRQGKDTSVKAIENKKRGRPLMLGEELDMQVRTYLRAFRENGSVVNTTIAIGRNKKPTIAVYWSVMVDTLA